MNHMHGWKTWAGALIVAVGAIATYFKQPQLAEALYGVGAALGLVGIGHKIEKMSKE